MKTTIFKTLSLIAAVAMVFNLSSCGDSDEPNGNGDSEGKNDPEEIFTAGLPKKVDGDVLTYNDSGQLTTVSDEHGIVAEFTYQDGKVVMTEDDCKSVFEIGDNGFASKVTINYEGETPFDCVFTYNSDGQMTSATYVYEDGRTESYTLTYENGDIVNSVKYDTSDRDWKSIDTFGYGSKIENKGCIMLFDFIYVDFDGFEYGYYAGILGKPTKHLPETSTGTGENLTTGEIINYGKSRYEWTMNGNGLPTLLQVFSIDASGEEHEGSDFTIEW